MSTSLRPGELLRLERVTCGYGQRPVIVDVDLVVAAGQLSGIVGPSGSGKTTLLRTLTGTIRPAAGTVRRRPGVRIGYVPQVDSVSWSFPVTVSECVLMARTTGRRLPWASRGERAEVAAVLERLGIGDLGERHIRALSGGQQQRMFIARALLRDPELLLLDEPTSGVDVKTRHEVLHLLDELHGDGLAIVLTTHDLNGIAAHLPHLVCLNREVIQAGTPREVLTAEVLEHAGMPVVVDDYRPDADVVRLRRGTA